MTIFNTFTSCLEYPLENINTEYATSTPNSEQNFSTTAVVVISTVVIVLLAVIAVMLVIILLLQEKENQTIQCDSVRKYHLYISCTFLNILYRKIWSLAGYPHRYAREIELCTKASRFLCVATQSKNK